MGVLKWGNESLGNLKDTLQDLKAKLAILKEDVLIKGNYEMARAIKEELDGLLAMEEEYWRQRSRVRWLKEGDLNTAFFHASVTQRQKRNNISRLRNEQ